MPEQEIDPLDRDYLSYNWGSLPWSDWVPFNADKQTFHKLPMEPGVYRIKPVDKDCLMYVGETGRACFERLNELRQTLRRADLMPWNDPYTEAPGLWCWWKEWISESGTSENAEPVMLECSAAPLDASMSGRKGMACFLLYKYRQEYGESPLCNFGRFHPRYRKSTSRKEGRRGGKLEEGQKDNPAGFPSIAPLEAVGRPGDRNWMDLEWSDTIPLAPENIRKVPAGAGLWLLTDSGSQEILFIGQSSDVAKRLLDQSRKTLDGHEIQFSYQIIGQNVYPHNLKELENDLIGNYFEIGQVIRPGRQEGRHQATFEFGQVIRPGRREESEGFFELRQGRQNLEDKKNPSGFFEHFRKPPEFQFKNTR